MVFSAKQIAALDSDLDDAVLSHVSKGRADLEYLKPSDVFAAANRIFGYHGWGFVVTDKGYDAENQLYWADVVVTVLTEGMLAVTRPGDGVCLVAIPKDEKGTELKPGQRAHQTARKGAVSDAVKRAFRTFGAQFGNGLNETEEAEGPVALADSSGVHPPVGLEQTVCQCKPPLPATFRHGTNERGRWAAFFCSKPRDQGCGFKQFFPVRDAPKPVKAAETTVTAAVGSGTVASAHVVEAKAAPTKAAAKVAPVAPPPPVQPDRQWVIEHLKARRFSETELAAWCQTYLAARSCDRVTGLSTDQWRDMTSQVLEALPGVPPAVPLVTLTGGA
jgi:hypothetical protein